MSVGPG